MSWQAHRIVVTWEILIKKKQALLYVELYAHKKHLIICNMAKCITEKFRKFIYSHTVLKLFLKMSRRVTYNIIHNCLLYTNIYGKCKMYWYIHTVYKTQTFNSLISLLAILFNILSSRSESLNFLTATSSPVPLFRHLNTTL